MRNLLILFLSLSLIAACDDDCGGFKLGKEFEIALNETVENCPKNISVTLLDIQDSRCAADLNCIWAGMIVVEGQLQADGQDFEFQLSTNENASGFPQEFSTPEFTVKLIDAVPYPSSPQSDQTVDQRAILSISKRSS